MSLSSFWPGLSDLPIYLESFHTILIIDALEYILVSIEKILFFLPDCFLFFYKTSYSNGK